MKIEIELNEEEVTEAVTEYLEKRGYDVSGVRINVGRDFGRHGVGGAVFKNVEAEVQDNRHNDNASGRFQQTEHGGNNGK